MRFSKLIVKIFFILSIFSFFTFLNYKQVHANSTNKNILDMTFIEKKQFLEDNNIVIPSFFSEDEQLEEFLNYIFETLYFHKDFVFCINYSETNQFIEKIRELIIVRNLYSNSDILLQSDYRDIPELKNSLVYRNGEWVKSGGNYSDDFLNYNCYSFAIDRIDYMSEFLNPLNSGRYNFNIGELSGLEWEISYSIEDTLEIIVADLNKLGYKNIEISTTIPANINNKDLICYRSGTIDFHFMKYDKIEKCWFHKIGESAIMKYIGEFNNNVSWISEYSHSGKEYEAAVLYDSPIYYITYDSNDINLNCYTEQNYDNTLFYLNDIKNDYIYDIYVESSRDYFLIFDCNYSFKIYLYDAIGNIIYEQNSIFLNNSYSININQNLIKGKYYLQLIPLEKVGEFPISSTFLVHNVSCYSEVYYSDNDILNLIHDDFDSNTKHITLKYYNTQGPNFFEFKITGNIHDAMPLTYPENCIKVYTDKDQNNLLGENLIDDTDIICYSNRLNIYLPSNGYYYIDINLNDFDYSSLKFYVLKSDITNFDISNNLETDKIATIFESVDEGSYFEKVMISHRCKIILDVITDESFEENIPILILRQQYLQTNSKYYLQTIFSDNLTINNNSPRYEIILDEGNYYFGFLNNISFINITYMIMRTINYESILQDNLVADPYEIGYDLGSEVTFNSGSCDSYTITEGFTRNIYLLAEDKFSIPMSRLEYEWYSSNESVAVVSSYGTVLALPVEKNTQVVIYAILRIDPSIIYKKTFTILDDNDDDSIVISCEMSYSYSNENERYQLKLNSSNCPYPMVQYYDFEIFENTQVNEFNVELNYWGYVTATSIGNCLIIGTYRLNTRVKIYINLSIIA